jgi:hypothetical protein
VTGGGIVHGVLRMMGDTSLHLINISQALQQAQLGDASDFSKRSSQRPNYPFLVISCQDWLHNSTFEELLIKQRLAKTIAPHTWRYSGAYMIEVECLHWPAPLTNPETKNTPVSPDVPPILLVNTLYDHRTSYAEAVSVHEQLPGSILITRNATDHTSYGHSEGVNALVDGYLIKGELPDDGIFVETWNGPAEGRGILHLACRLALAIALIEFSDEGVEERQLAFYHFNALFLCT